MDGYKVIRGSGVSMTSPEGSVLLASMFGDTFGPDDVEVFPIELPGMSVMSPHLHTADLVAWVTRGRMAFGFGVGLADRIELDKDDVIWLRAREPHSEEVVGDNKVTMVIAHVRPFETEPA